MLKVFLKIGFVRYLWKRYIRLLVYGVISVLLIMLVVFLHDDYMVFIREVSDSDENIKLSYYIKWSLLLSIVAIYVAYVYFHSKRLAASSKDKSYKNKIVFLSGKLKSFGGTFVHKTINRR